MLRMGLRQGAEIPPRFWHHLIFYTVGTLTQKILAEDGVDGYEPYAIRAGLVQRDGMRQAWPVLERYWGAFLAGTNPRGAALNGVASAYRID